jgi:glycosyltransferase involved in cell wall biosynthesis
LARLAHTKTCMTRRHETQHEASSSEYCILHVTPHYAPAWAYGGPPRIAHALCKELAARDHHVTVFTNDSLGPGQRYVGPRPAEIDGVRIFYFRNLSNALKARLNLSTPLGLERTARRLLPAFDLIHCHELRTVENLIVTPVAAQLRKPLLLTPHGTLPYETGRGGIKAMWDRLFGRALMRRFAHVAAESEQAMREVRALRARLALPPKVDYRIIPNGVTPDEFASLPPSEAFRARWGIPLDAPLVLFLGRLHPRKGLDVLIPALARASVPDAWLAVVGPDEGAHGAARALAGKMGLGDRAVFTGLLGGDDKLAALAAADVFALPAVGEGMPIAALEACASGLPVLLSEGCNLPEVAAAGAGRVLPRDVEAWAEALEALLSDPEARATMSELARRMVGERFTWSAVVDRLEAFYDAILG